MVVGGVCALLIKKFMTFFFFSCAVLSITAEPKNKERETNRD